MGEEAVEKMTKMPSATASAPAPAHFVLIHGASHGRWCWYKVQTLLESSGHKVTSLDLKGSGVDPADANDVVSFDDYNQPLVHFLSSLPDDHQKVILVGHSAGGISVTEAIHKFPGKIQAAVYVAATMLKFGFQSHQDLKDGAPDLSEFGKIEVHDFGYGLGADQPPTSAIFKKELQRKFLYQMSPLEDCTLAAMLLRPYPMAIIGAKHKEGEEEIKETAERVPRIYIKTLQDRVIKPEQQDVMIKRWPPTQVYNVDSDHSPFFSNPFLLSGFLVKVADSFTI